MPHRSVPFPIRRVPVTTDSFGYLLAYLLPGFLLLWGLGDTAPIFRAWLDGPATDPPTIGGFLYATVASLGAGLLLSALRWATLDRIYHRTGIPEPQWDFAKLAERLPAFEGIVLNHYRFAQGYGNALVALVLIGAMAVATHPTWETVLSGRAVCVLAVAVLLVLASRDTLRKYYTRAAQLMRSEEPMETDSIGEAGTSRGVEGAASTKRS